MKQLEGFTMKGKEESICKIKKYFYGLKQSPRIWYQKFESYVQGLGFKRSHADHCVYRKQDGDNFIYVALYVDDMFLVCNNMDMIKEAKQQLSFKFDMKDLGPTHLTLGMEIKINRV